MPKFLVQATYTSKGSQGLVKEGGTGRRDAVERVTQQLGGKVESTYFAFGDVDLYSILDFPDNVSMAAVALAVKASGAIQTKATVLLTPEEIDAAAKKSVEFRPPGA
ncbi:GYD domain-containing protein [Actinopolymorpha sp. NPDC004070]|uniref:GYD domain-containing protein n=1 Tax=Actinopolymorpha sp. NPDC004070 TaxID=3154548 RepID=UPI0033A20B72